VSCCLGVAPGHTFREFDEPDEEVLRRPTYAAVLQAVTESGINPRDFASANPSGVLADTAAALAAKGMLSGKGPRGGGSASNIPPLSFESRFESGNLGRAIQISEREYDLLVSHDINSTGHTQWFFFRMQNMVPGVKYKFNILNLEKKNSAFSKGMRPVMFSLREALLTGVGWHRCMIAEDIFYYPNHR